MIDLKLPKQAPMQCPYCTETLEGQAQDHVESDKEGWVNGSMEDCTKCEGTFYSFIHDGHVFVEGVVDG